MKKIMVILLYLILMIFIGNIRAYGADAWVPASQGLTNLGIRALAVDPDGRVFAGTSGGGIFRSTDRGANWTPVNQGLTGSNINNIIVISNIAIDSEGRIFAGGDYNYGRGLFRSLDHGDTWTSITFQNPVLPRVEVPEIASMAVSPAGHVVIGCFGYPGLTGSTDHGETWNNPPPAWVGSPRTMIIPREHEIVKGSGFGMDQPAGISRSTDGGTSFQSLGHISIGESNVLCLAMDEGANLFASCNINSEADVVIGNVLFRSSDMGMHWTRLRSGLPKDISVGHSGMGCGIALLNRKNMKGLLLGLGNQSMFGYYSESVLGVYCSTDGGNNWVDQSAGLASRDVQALAEAPDGTVYAGTANNGVFRSADGHVFVPVELSEFSVE